MLQAAGHPDNHRLHARKQPQRTYITSPSPAMHLTQANLPFCSLHLPCRVLFLRSMICNGRFESKSGKDPVNLPLVICSSWTLLPACGSYSSSAQLRKEHLEAEQ